MAELESHEGKRRRGVQASPEKLLRALTERGFKSQAALAEHIAVLEGLDVAPRGLVNRIFRGDSVDVVSLERIAKALNVRAHSLYRSSADAEAATSKSELVSSDVAKQHGVSNEATIQPGHTPPAKEVANNIADAAHHLPTAALRPAGVAVVIAILLGLFLSGLLLRARAPEPVSRPTNVSVIVLPWRAVDELSNEQRTHLLASLRNAVQSRWRVLPWANAGDDAQALTRNGLAERVVQGEAHRLGRWLLLSIEVHERNAMQVAWQGVLRASQLNDRYERLMQEASSALTADRAVPVEHAEALTHYLEGRLALDAGRNELNVRRAMTGFSSAIRLSPNFVDAYAGLCEALVVDNVRTGDLSRLTEAEKECAHGEALDPMNLELRRVRAYLARKQGKLPAALEGFTSVLAQSPADVDALLGVVEVHLTRFGRGEDADGLTKARETALLANRLEPTFWKVPFALARVYYTAGERAAAIRSSRDAVSLDANVISLANLGTFEFCDGNFDAARAAYMQAKQLQPDEFVGIEQLAVVHYFLHDFAAAASGFKEALDLQTKAGKAADHRLWGNYADALRHLNDNAGATSAYVRAIALAEQDVTRGDGNPVHPIYRASYYAMLTQLDPERWSSFRISNDDLKALHSTNDPMALLHLTLLHRRLGDADSANSTAKRGAEGCPGFLQSPDLK